MFEQHGGTKPNHPPEQNSGQTAPLNVLTGHPAPADGFSSAPVTAGNGVPVPAPGSLWVHAAAPFAAIYQTDGTTFTYISDLPPEQADDGVAALVRARTAAPGTAGNAGPGPEDAAAAPQDPTASGPVPEPRPTSLPGWSAAWAGLWRCWPRDSPIRRGTPLCVFAESSPFRLRG
ncbi:hypothetical protein ACOM2C_07315 [Pseudarthrobacter sp. So.54]